MVANNLAEKICAGLAALLPFCVLAQPAPNYLDEMAKIDAQIAYIQKQNELRNALQKSSTSEGMPRILSITVDDRGATAQVIYTSGIVRWVKKGDVLLDGMSVQAIGKSSVLVGGRGGRYSLAFAAPQTGMGGEQQNASVGLPPVPRINIPMPLPPAPSPVLAPAAPAAPAAAPAAGK